MHDHPSLLGQFFTRIRGSQEDIATEGVNYLLNRSAAARNGLTSIIRNRLGLQLPVLSFRTQATGDNGERPDIVGVTTDGKEVMIIESKFWSSLTDNQPQNYIKRFTEDDSILLFICPSLRVRTLWQEVKLRLPPEYQIDEENHRARCGTKHVLIETWSTLLTSIREHLVQSNESILVSDVDQIIGLCNVIDQNTFLPISDEDIAPAIPRRISSYYDLVDKVLDEMRKHLPIDLTGMKATAQRTGYTRYFKYLDLGLSLQLNYELWRNSLDTPFWLGFQRTTTGSWIVDETLQMRVRESGRVFYHNSGRLPHYPLLPPRNVTEDVVVRHMANEAVHVIRILSEQKN